MFVQHVIRILAIHVKPKRRRKPSKYIASNFEHGKLSLSTMLMVFTGTLFYRYYISVRTRCSIWENIGYQLCMYISSKESRWQKPLTVWVFIPWNVYNYICVSWEIWIGDPQTPEWSLYGYARFHEVAVNIFSNNRKINLFDYNSNYSVWRLFQLFKSRNMLRNSLFLDLNAINNISLKINLLNETQNKWHSEIF